MINKIQTGTTTIGQFWDKELAPLIGARKVDGSLAPLVSVKEKETPTKKQIDWAEFDKQDQIIMSSNE